MITLFTALA